MKLLTYFLAFILFSSLASSLTYEQEFIIDKEVNVNILINFDNKKSFDFYLNLPEDVDKINVLLDNQEKEFEILNYNLDNFARVNGNAQNIKINYYTKAYLEETKKSYFTSEVISLLNSRLIIKVILPEGAVLDKPFIDDLKQASVYPKAGKIETNGKNLIVSWEYDAKEGEAFPLFIIYNNKRFNYLYLILIPIIILFIFLIKRKKIIKIKKIKVNVEKYLKNEEKAIINLLKQKKGKCEQATLVTLSNISKASLSRLLNELETRNIIYKEKIGKKNLIILKRR